MRLIEDLDLDLDGLRVLFGENGSGKSTILEALEILRRTTSIEFWKDLCSVHGGFAHLIRPKTSNIELAIEIAPLAGEAGEFLRYEIRIPRDGVEAEHLRAGTGDRSARMESVFLRQGGIYASWNLSYELHPLGKQPSIGKSYSIEMWR